MKKILLNILVLSVCLNFSDSVRGQIDKDVTFMGNDSTWQSFFEYGHELNNRGDLESLRNTYTTYAVFKIDTTGSIIDFGFKEIRGVELPDSAKKYLTKLINWTNRKWLPKIANSKPVISDEIVCEFTLINKKQNLSNRMNDQVKIFESVLNTRGEFEKKLILNKNTHRISLTY